MFPSGDEVTLSRITGRVAAAGRTGNDNGDREKFPAANEVSLQRYKNVSPLSVV